ncbi:MAG TPA: VCBS repeat-containing protein [Nannocystaceae bacterium]|nr:VCBS repeat-containing protein [Nannocystaceae bacterium]
MPLALVPACFDPGAELRGKPCTSDASCGDLSCAYGFCGGPPRCERGASVGDYCFELGDEAFAVADGARALALGRVDLDPFADVVTAAADGRISLLLNDGMQGLAPSIDSSAIAAGPTGLGIGDVDGVGWHEMIVTTDDGRVVVAPASEAGFDPAVVAGTGLVDPSLPTVGNFFADLQGGVPDVAVLVGDGMGVLPQGQPLAFDPAVVTFIDSPSDIATLSEDGAFALVSRTSENDIQVLERGLDGHYTPLDVIDVGGPPARFVLADLDGDDYGDILSADTSGQLWLTSAKTASPASPDDWAMPRLVYELGWVPAVLSVGNLDDDDALELIIAGPADDERSDVFLFDNDGDGVPLYGGSLGVPEGTAVAAGELDGDGVPEIVVASDAVRIARRTVAPPPPGDQTSGESGPGPMTSVDTVEPTSTDPTIDPTDDPTNVEVGEETFGPGCPGYDLGGLCFGVTGIVPHGLLEVTAIIELRALASASLLGVAESNMVVGGASATVINLGQSNYEVLPPEEVPGYPTGGDIGVLIGGGGGDSAITTPDGLIVLSPGVGAAIAVSSGANAREPVIMDLGDDEFSDVVMAVDDGIAIVRGSDIQMAAADPAFIPIERIELAYFTDLDKVPLFAPGPAKVIASSPDADSILGLGPDAGSVGILSNLPATNPRFAAFGSFAGTDYLLSASGSAKAPQLEILFPDGMSGDWALAGSLGSAEGIVQDLATLDIDFDGIDDVFAMVDDGSGARRIDVYLYRDEQFEVVASIVDVPDALFMVPVSRGEEGRDLLIVDALQVWIYSQVFYG